MNMATTPAIDKPAEASKYVSYENKEETSLPFDWNAYLMEGVEIDPAIGQESSDESVWSEEDIAVGEAESPKQDVDVAASGDQEYLTDLASELENLAMERESLQAVEQQEHLLQSINESWRASEKGYRQTAVASSSQFPASSLINNWLELSKEEKPSIRILSEYMIIRELLWVLRDPNACGLVFQHDGDSKFSVMTDLAVCSLTPQALQTALSRFCPVLTTIHEMQTFIADLIPSIDKDNNEPPATYKAYACGLHALFIQQNAFLSDLEKRVMKQDNITTVQSVSSELQKWVDFQLSLFSIHKKAVENWKTEDLWKCASKLLSVLGSAVDADRCNVFAAVCLSLLLRSLQPYLDLMEIWLKSGTLQDSNSEFLIFERAVDDKSGLESNYEIRAYAEYLHSQGVEPLLLLKPLVTYGEVAGRSIKLLQGLKSMDSVPHPSNKESLHAELLKTVRAKLLPTANAVDDVDVGFQDSEPENPPELMHGSRSTLDQYMLDYLLSSNDTYMLKAFGDILDLGLDVCHPQEAFSLPKDQPLFKPGEVGTLQPIAPELSDCLEQLLAVRVEGLGQRARQLLHERCRLSVHLAAVRSVALLEAGDAMNQFLSYLTDKIAEEEDWRKWTTWYLLTNQLQACLSQHQWSHMFSIAIKDNSNISATSEITEGFPLMQLINHLELQYTMEWPINLVFREENMEMYNNVFRFLSKVKCALLSLQKLCLKEPRDKAKHSSRENTAEDDQKVEERRKLRRRLAVLRTWLLFLLGCLQEHLLGHILTTLRIQLDSALSTAKDLQSVLAAHDLFVKKAHSYCLMEAKSLPSHNMIMEVVALAMAVCDVWHREDLTTEQVTAFETDYGKLYTFLTYLFSNLTRLGANLHLAGVAAALLDSCPTY